jgi:hypothetical protein
VELLELEKSGIRVAAYWTKLLPRNLLKRKLHAAAIAARERLSQIRAEKEPPVLLPEDKEK